MTVKEKIINNLNQMIVELTNIKKSFEDDNPPGNEEWIKVATPLNEMVNLLPQGMFNNLKNENYEKDELLTISKWQQKKKNYQDGEISQREIS